MTTEPNNEQARELSEKELEGIAGGTEIGKIPRPSYTLIDNIVAIHEVIKHDPKVAVLTGSGR